MVKQQFIVFGLIPSSTLKWLPALPQFFPDVGIMLPTVEPFGTWLLNMSPPSSGRIPFNEDPNPNPHSSGPSTPLKNQTYSFSPSKSYSRQSSSSDTDLSLTPKTGKALHPPFVFPLKLVLFLLGFPSKSSSYFRISVKSECEWWSVHLLKLNFVETLLGEWPFNQFNHCWYQDLDVDSLHFIFRPRGMPS